MIPCIENTRPTFPTNSFVCGSTPFRLHALSSHHPCLLATPHIDSPSLTLSHRFNDQLAMVRENHEESLAEAEEHLQSELSALSAQHQEALAAVREEGVVHATQIQQLTEERLCAEWTKKINNCEEEWTERTRKVTLPVLSLFDKFPLTLTGPFSSLC